MISLKDVSDIVIVLLILDIPLVFFICQYLWKLREEVILRIQSKKFNHVIKIMPWIYKQIERSTESIYSSYRTQILANASSSYTSNNITIDTYNTMIQEIRTHFYGSVPKVITKEILFDYIDANQIDILILNEYNKINGGYFKLVTI